MSVHPKIDSTLFLPRNTIPRFSPLVYSGVKFVLHETYTHLREHIVYVIEYTYNIRLCFFVLLWSYRPSIGFIQLFSPNPQEFHNWRWYMYGGISNSERSGEIWSTINHN